MGSISPEQVSGIDLFLYVVQDGIVAVCDDAAAHFFELFDVVDDLAAEEGGAVLQGGLVNDDGGALGLDAFHNALDGALAEVVAVGLHGQAENADNDFFFAATLKTVIGIAVVFRFLQDPVRDEVLPCPVALHDGSDHVLRHVAVVCQELLGVLGQAVAAVAEGGVVVVVAHPGIQADALNDLGGVQTLDLSVGVQLVEVGDPQGKVGVDEQLGGLRLGVAHEQGLNGGFNGTLLEQTGEDPRLGLRVLVAAHDDAAGVEVVVEGLGLPQKLRAENDIIHAHLLPNGHGKAHGDRGFDDDGGLLRALGGGLLNQRQDGFHGGAVEEVLLRVVVGGGGHDDEICVGVGGSAVVGGAQMQRPGTGLGLCQILFNVLVLDGGDVVVQLLHLFGDDIHGSDRVVLGQQHCQGQAHVAGASHGDLVMLFHGDGSGDLGIDEHRGGIEDQHLGECQKLVNGGGVVLCLQPGQQSAVDAGHFRYLDLREPLCLAVGGNGIREQLQR